MLNIKTQIVTTLNTILPTMYEYICNSKTPKPCITYAETNSMDTLISKETGVSRMQFTIKVWIDNGDVSEMQNYAGQVDTKMRELGFTRVSANELVVGNQIEKILLYEIIMKENYII